MRALEEKSVGASRPKRRASALFFERLAHNLSGSAGALRIFLELKQRASPDCEFESYQRLIGECRQISKTTELLVQLQELSNSMRGGSGSLGACLTDVESLITETTNRLDCPPSRISCVSPPEAAVFIDGFKAANLPCPDFEAICQHWSRDRNADRRQMLEILLGLSLVLAEAHIALRCRIHRAGTLELRLEKFTLPATTRISQSHD
jgi:hypothetical protein